MAGRPRSLGYIWWECYNLLGTPNLQRASAGRSVSERERGTRALRNGSRLGEECPRVSFFRLFTFTTVLNSLTLTQPPLLARTRHMKVGFPSRMVLVCFIFIP